jgi:signal transduction histidine kinase
VALIAIEALHNAARHAGATRVVLGLEPDGLRWKLWIEDDGHGPGATPASTGSGLGIESMKRRAEEIGWGRLRVLAPRPAPYRAVA